jgi:hypothetical protein
MPVTYRLDMFGSGAGRRSNQFGSFCFLFFITVESSTAPFLPPRAAQGCGQPTSNLSQVWLLIEDTADEVQRKYAKRTRDPRLLLPMLAQDEMVVSGIVPQGQW